MICSQCGTENAAGARFCHQCGTALSSACQSCGSQNPGGAKFCSSCGTQLAAAATAPAPAPPADPAAARAERRVVSVLFADLVGFTTLAEDRDPEETRDLLARYFDASRQVIERYGGAVEKFIGDAVMAVWGTPVAHEDDAERAVRAALDLVDAVRAMGGQANAEGLTLRAGVLTGEAAVNLAASGQGMVAGDLVNTASRLQSVAPAGAVLVGEATFRSASTAIAFEPVGDQDLKGKTLPVPAYRALRVVARRSGAGRSDQLEPPFVGRDAELRLLKELMHASADEHRARLVSVMGPAGIGKSRLVWELVKYLDGITEQIYWHHGRCPAYGDGVSFWALGEMVRVRAGIAETEDHDAGNAKLEAMLAQFVPDEEERRWMLPAVQQLLGLPSGGSTSDEGLFAAWRTLFERIAQQGAVLMVFEDLQWADPGLLDFIEHLLEWSRSHPIFIVTLARPELLDRRPTWGAGQRNFTNLALEPLAGEAMEALLRGLVPGLPESAIRRILERAEGVPLYAVETVRMLIAEGRVERSNGSFRPVGDLAELAVPESLQTVVTARLDAVGAEDRKILQAASVLGKTFTVGTLTGVAGLEAEQLEERLRLLVRRELLVHETDPRSPERGQYGFVQGLIREVAYGTLARRDRRQLHLAAARGLEQLGDEELAGVLATHYLAAFRAQPEGPEAEPLAVQARIALRAAAERATRLASHQLAQSYLEQALEVTSDDRERAELHHAAGSAALTAGAFEPMERHLTAAVELYQVLGDREGELSAIARLGDGRVSLGHVEAALPELEAAAEQFGDLSSTRAWVALAEILARTYMRLGPPEQALEWCERGLPLAEELDLRRLILHLLITRATCLPGVNRHQEAIALMHGARRLAAEEGMPAIEVRALVNLGFISSGNDFVTGYEASLEGIELAHRYGLGYLFGYLFGNLLDAALRIGEWDRVLSELDRALAVDLDEEKRTGLSHRRLWIEALRGTIDASQLPSLDEAQEPQHRGMLHEFAAHAAISRGDLDTALREALAAADSSLASAYSGFTLARRMALWQGAVAEASAAQTAATGKAFLRGRAAEAARIETEAGLAALDGRQDDALRLFADALQHWDVLRARFDRALCQITLVRTVAGDSSEVRRAADEARAVLTELGATPLLRYLDDVPASAPASAASAGEMGARSDDRSLAGRRASQ